MSEVQDIRVIIDGSLLEHIKKGIQAQHIKGEPEEVITSFLEIIINQSDLPIEARRTGDQELRISHHIRSFSQPFFDF